MDERGAKALDLASWPMDKSIVFRFRFSFGHESHEENGAHRRSVFMLNHCENGVHIRDIDSNRSQHLQTVCSSICHRGQSIVSRRPEKGQIRRTSQIVVARTRSYDFSSSATVMRFCYRIN